MVAMVARIQSPKETVATRLSCHQMLPMVAKTIAHLPHALGACRAFACAVLAHMNVPPALVHSLSLMSNLTPS